MSLYIDKKYVNLVSTSLEKFKWKKVNLANCRCPICGDSETNKNKARGYFFGNTDSYFYKCHNCGISYNIYKFLEIVSPVLFKEYCLEKFKDKNTKIEFETEKLTQERLVQVKYDMIEELSPDHVAIEFLQTRIIPEDKWDRFGYTKTFGLFAKQLNPDYNLLEQDERILIPIFDENNQLVGVQGRAIGNIKPKYITLKKNDDVRLVYGMDTVDKSKPIYVVEGPIDSLFLPNAIAVLGLGNFLEIRKKLQNQNLIFILDNEPRSRNVSNIIKELIDINEKVVIFPSHIKDKDINDMVLNGINVVDIIEEHTYSGAAAMMAFNIWRKCL
jgi:DNA primase